jgi:carotenoid cleavage dioxygenase-like enzyme
VRSRQHDVRDGRTEVRDFGLGCVCLEPVFVPQAGATEEDDGYVMAYVYNGLRTAGDVVSCRPPPAETGASAYESVAEP